MPFILKTWGGLTETKGHIHIEEETVIDGLDSDVYEDEDLMDKLTDFVFDIDVDTLTDQQLSNLNEILDIIESYQEDDEDGMSEAMAAKKKKIDKRERMKRKKDYRINKAKLKRKAKLYRKSAKGKRMAKKAKRMSKLGKTATGKRKTTFI